MVVVLHLDDVDRCLSTECDLAMCEFCSNAMVVKQNNKRFVLFNCMYISL